MWDYLPSVLQIATIIYAAGSMAAVGLSYTFQEIIAPLRNVRSVLIALFANFVAVPLLALFVVRLFNLPFSLGIGLLLVATASGAPFLLQLTRIARGDVRLAAGLLVLQVVVSMAFVPLVVPLMEPEARVSAVAIAQPLVLTMLVPLGIGLLVDRWNGRLAAKVQPILQKVALVALVALVLSTFALHLPAVAGVFGTGAIFGALVVVLGAFGIGYLLPGPDTRKRKVLGLGTAQRGIAAATVVATQTFTDPNVVVMVVVTMVVSLVVLFPLAWAIGRRASPPPELTVTLLEETREKEPQV